MMVTSPACGSWSATLENILDNYWMFTVTEAFYTTWRFGPDISCRLSTAVTKVDSNHQSLEEKADLLFESDTNDIRSI